MMELLKDRYKLSMLLAVIFLAGILVSIYSIYSLPYRLSLTDGYQSSFARVYAVITFTFLTGGLAIWLALQYKNEVIVFREKSKLSEAQSGEKSESGQATISMDTVKAALKQSKSDRDLLQNGLHAVCHQLSAGQGAVYLAGEHDGVRKVELTAGYALTLGESTVIAYEFGEGLVGQAAAGNKTIYLDEVPEGYIRILSGLGSASPRYLLIVPMREEDRMTGVVEIASFTPLNEEQRNFVEGAAQLMAQQLKSN